MKNIIIGLLFLTSIASFAQSGRLINIFYEERDHTFAVNIYKDNGDSGFIRTKKMVLLTNKLASCKDGCLAEIKGITDTSFAILAEGHKVATVTINDPDNLLPSKSFKINEDGQIVLDLNQLIKSQNVEVE